MNYILKYTGDDEPDADLVLGLLNNCNISILDNSALPRMLLLKEVTEEALLQLKSLLPGGWILIPQKNFRVPDTKRKARKK